MDEREAITIAGIEVPAKQRTPLVDCLLRVIGEQRKDTKNTKEDDARKDAKTGNKQTVKATPKRVELAQMAVGVIVHPENLLDSLPLDELRSIFTGEIKAWPGMKESVAKMHLVGLDPQSPLTLLFREKLATTSPSTGTSGDTFTGRSAADFSLAKYTAKNDTEQVVLTAVAMFAVTGAAGLVIAMFAWFGNAQRKRKKW